MKRKQTAGKTAPFQDLLHEVIIRVLKKVIAYEPIRAPLLSDEDKSNLRESFASVGKNEQYSILWSLIICGRVGEEAVCVLETMTKVEKDRLDES